MASTEETPNRAAEAQSLASIHRSAKNPNAGDAVALRIAVIQNASIREHMSLSTYLRNLLVALASNSRIDILALVSGGSSRDIGKSNVTVLSSGTSLYSIWGNIRYTCWCFRKLRKAARAARISLVHCVDPASSVTAALAFKLLVSPSTLVVYDLRGPWIEMAEYTGRFPRFLTSVMKGTLIAFEQLLTRRIDGVVFITDALRRLYQMEYRCPVRKHEIAPSGVDLSLFKPKQKQHLRSMLSIPDNLVVGGYVGAIANIRRLDFVISAIMSDRAQNLFLVMVGDGDSRQRLEAMAGGCSRIKFTGYIEPEELPDIISGFDFGICHLPPARVFNVSFPLKVLEYAACDIPIVMSKMPAHVEIAKSVPQSALYVPSIESFLQAVERATKSPAGAARKSSEAFDWRATAKTLTSFYKSLYEARKT